MLGCVWNKKLWRCMPHSDAFLHRGTCCCSDHLPGRERPGALRLPHWLIFTVLWYVPQWFRALRTKLKGTGTLDGIPGRDTLHTLYFYIRLHKILSWLYRIWIKDRVWVCDNGLSYRTKSIFTISVSKIMRRLLRARAICFGEPVQLRH